MTHFRLRWRKLGGHIHVRVFSSEFGADTTHGKNGDLVFREQEWQDLVVLLGRGAMGDKESTVDLIHEHDDEVAL